MSHVFNIADLNPYRGTFKPSALSTSIFAGKKLFQCHELLL